MNPRRRDFLLAAGLGPLGGSFLSACGRNSGLPEGMIETKWDRDTCVRCSMVISDRRFAAQVKGGPGGANFKFDDIGCAVFWLKDKPWAKDARIWVADLSSRGEAVGWLDAHKAQYVGGKTSPMGYNYGAVALPQPGSLTFDDMRSHVLAKGR